MNRTASTIWLHGALLIVFLSFYLAFLRQPWEPPQEMIGGNWAGGIWWGIPPFIHLLLLWFLAAAIHLVLRRALPAADDAIFLLYILLSGIALALIAGLSPRLKMDHSPYLVQFTHWILAMFLIPLAALLFGQPHRCTALYRFLRYRYHFLAITAIALLIATAIGGVELNHRRLWLKLVGISFQPVEFVKAVMILFTASVFQRLGEDMKDYHSPGASLRKWLSRFFPWFYPWPIIFLTLLVMKDLGPLLILALIFIFFFSFAGMRWEFSLGAILFSTVAFYICFTYRFPLPLWTRVDACLNPSETNPMVWQSILAVASGGLFGKGIGGADTAIRIPHLGSDYLFSLSAEELGLTGAAAILTLYLLFSLRSYWIAYRLPGTYEKLLAFGIGTLVALHLLVSVSGNLGIIPQTGIVIPFFSFGGSSLLANAILCGILLGISENRRHHDASPLSKIYQ